ncbi:MAG TPA: Sec-independent protein translocase protein TatB [Xanthobacteraceae bacterium]|jgi:sec-independent protein translocase protein TatB|nr:Sec-independent protein translocase protein TatB [Xanthobacteraceae bacterium]
MFDIGWGELIVIGVVALIAIGPKELPSVLRTVGQWVVRIRRLAGDFQSQFQDAMREAELHDLKQQVEDLGKSVKFDDGYDEPYNNPPDTVAAETKGSDEPLMTPLSDAHTAHADVAHDDAPARPDATSHDSAPAQMVPDAGGEVTGGGDAAAKKPAEKSA